MEENILGIGSRIKHPAYGDGVIIRIHKAAYDVCFTLYGIKQVGKTYEKWEIIERIEPEDEVSYTAAEKSLLKIFRAYDILPEENLIATKYRGGTMIIKPADETLKEKEIPIETFFHKIVMVRDRLRVIEQKINSNKALSEAEKVNLQQYITRSYGSLTTFNVLFKDKNESFSGQKQS